MCIYLYATEIGFGDLLAGHVGKLARTPTTTRGKHHAQLLWLSALKMGCPPKFADAGIKVATFSGIGTK